MRLVIDLQTCQRAAPAVARYHLEQALALARSCAGHELWLALDGRIGAPIEAIRSAFDGLLSQQRIVVYDLPAPAEPPSVWRSRADELIREAALAALAPDLIYVPDMFGAADAWPAAMPASIGALSARSASVVSLVDPRWLCAARPDEADARAEYCRRHAALRNAALVLVDSDAACAGVGAALGLEPGQLRSIDLALTAQATATASTTHWVMLHAGADLRSHATLLISAYARLDAALLEHYRLLIVGEVASHTLASLHSYARGLGLGAEQLAFAGQPSDAELHSYYADTAVLACLADDQLHAALEAIACGVPTIAPRDSALAQALVAAPALFAAAEPVALGATLALVLAEPDVGAALRAHALQVAAHSSMAHNAQQLWDAFEAVHAAHLSQPVSTAPRAAARPRLAYVSPLPPEQTGIADYSAELVPELARYYDIDLIIDQAIVSDPWIGANLPLRSVAWFEAHAHEFDRVLYHFGNSPMHQHMFGLLERHPGIVILHDFYLGNIIDYLDHTGYARGAYLLALYQSHGYTALVERQAIGATAAIWKYPCNKALLDQASGVIVHSHYPQQLAQQWYGADSAHSWRTLPLLRGSSQADPAAERASARLALGLNDDDFLVCSFGMLGPTKCNDVLLEAWLAGPLAKDSRCHLVFVGANDPGDFGRALQRRIDAGDGANAPRITGFVTHPQYCTYLAACDAAVQLRTNSRGETSAAVLDCLLYGVPTIANAHGASAELPDAVLYKLADRYTDDALGQALTALRGDAALRAGLSLRGRAYIRAEHAPGRVGQLYVEAIEQFARHAPYPALVNSLARITPPGCDMSALAVAISANARPGSGRQLFVDISALVQTDHKTGIQRVVRSVLKALLDDTPPGYRIEPVYSVGGGAPYRHARSASARLLGIDGPPLHDDLIDAKSGDLFLGLDLFTDGTVQNRARLQQLRERAVQVYFVVYDILPILRPDVFPPNAERDIKAWLPAIAAVSDGLVCISRTVADDVISYLASLATPRRRALNIGYFHLGADIDASAPSDGMPEGAEQILQQVRARPSLLMVGTLEPRKGHAQALAAFELLWEQGVAVNLVIVGKAGWMVDALVARLRRHPANGSKLFWLDGCSDEMLAQLYQCCQALLAPSEGEGFGLPLIEAAQHGIAIIARDLPVFREVAGAHAYYFDGLDARALADALTAWLALHAQGQAPGSHDMPWLTWAQCTQQLRACVLQQQWYRSVAGAPALLGLLEPVGPATTQLQAEPQLLVDVSNIVRHDLQTGIERVVRAQLHALLSNPPAGLRVEAVYLSNDGGAWHYRYARRYANRLVPGSVAAQQADAPDPAVEVQAGDLFYSPDYSPDAVAGAAAAGLYAQWRTAGVQVNFLIHDLLPVLRPDFFPDQSDRVHGRYLEAIARHADRLICISQAVADQLAQWLAKHVPQSSVKLAVLHHGADLGASVPSVGLPDNVEAVLAQLAGAPSFFVVGTIEPRKGYLQTLLAFEQLWAAGSDAILVIVGREGWVGLPDAARRSIPQIMARLANHPELGQRLLWLPGVSDEYLQKLYTAAGCLLAPSEGEGFGLPLIEAAQCGLPIIARDLPVFREVAQQHASYFSGLAAGDLAAAITVWLEQHGRGAAPSSQHMVWHDWAHNARELRAILAGGQDLAGTP